MKISFAKTMVRALEILPVSEEETFCLAKSRYARVVAVSDAVAFIGGEGSGVKIEPGLLGLLPAGREFGVKAVRQNPGAAQMLVISFSAIRGASSEESLPMDIRMHTVLESLLRESASSAPGQKFRQCALATCLVIDVLRKARNDAGKVHAGDAFGKGRLINHACEYIRKLHATPLTLGDIAWSVRLSEEHFSRLFKKETGITPFAYLRKVRVSKALVMLAESELSIPQIAEASGFSNIHSFYRAFRECRGCTPAVFRDNATSSLRES